MEKKKLLLVAVSVGVFLVIIISAAILIITPKASAENQARGTAVSAVRPINPGQGGSFLPDGDASRSQPATVDAADLVRAGGVQGMQSPPQATAIQETNFYINGEAPVDSYSVEKTDDNASAKVIINVPKPSTAAVPDVQIESPAPRQAAPAVSRPAAPARAPAPASKPAAAAPKPAAKPAAAARAPAQKTYNDYWVQTGAFSAKVRAEGAKETLASKGINSIIENREVEGKTWYRVRVGPYTSENEATYWLTLVKSIDGFAESQIRQTVSVR